MTYKLQVCRSCKTRYTDKVEIDTCPICRSKNIRRVGAGVSSKAKKTTVPYRKDSKKKKVIKSRRSK